MRGITAVAILAFLAGCAVSLANVVTSAEATESANIQIIVDGHAVGTLELLEYHLGDGVIEIITTEGIKGVQCDMIFRDCFEARD